MNQPCKETLMKQQQHKILLYLWTAMIGKFSKKWTNEYFDTPLSNTGQLTKIATSWSDELKGLIPSQIKSGVEALSTRKEKVWPPTPMEFKELCIGSEFDDVLDCVMIRLQEGVSYRWTNKLAFNIWAGASSDFQSMDFNRVPQLVKRRLSMIDRKSMFELPNYAAMSIEQKPPTPEMIASKQQRIIFQSHMYAAILNNQPTLFECFVLEPMTKRKLNREPRLDIPPIMHKIFSKSGTIELMKKFNESKRVMPEAPIKPKLIEFSKTEWHVKFRYYKTIAIEAVAGLLRDEGILS